MPVEEMTPGVARLRTLIANIYLVGSAGGPWMLVDTGTPGNAARIRNAAAQRFGPCARPQAILLTHGHWDHAGSALELAGYWDVPIYAHRLERPFLSGKSAYPPKDPMAGGAFSFLSRFFPSSTVDLGERLRDLPEGGEAPGLVGWRCNFRPGLPPGHGAYFHRGGSAGLGGTGACGLALALHARTCAGTCRILPAGRVRAAGGRCMHHDGSGFGDGNRGAGAAHLASAGAVHIRLGPGAALGRTAGRLAAHGDWRGSRRADERPRGDGGAGGSGARFPQAAARPLCHRAGAHGRDRGHVRAAAGARSAAEDCSGGGAVSVGDWGGSGVVAAG